MKKLFTLLAATAAVTCSAFGATISASNSPFAFGPTNTTFNTPYTFGQFNPALGTLNSVTFTVGGTTTFGGTIQNTSTTSQTYTITFDSLFSINTSASSPFGTLVSSAIPTQTQTLTVPAGSTSPVSASGTAANNSAVITTGLVTYTGTGTITDFIRGTGASSVDGSTPFTYSPNASGTGNVSVVYNYTAPTGTPEPATMGLLGSALVGLGFLKLRKKA